MDLSNQLRIILLLAGAAIWLAIYLFGRRKTTQRTTVAPVVDVAEQRDAAPGFIPAPELDEDEFETPAYMRRQGQREPRQDYEPRVAKAHDYADIEVRNDDAQWVDRDHGDDQQMDSYQPVRADRDSPEWPHLTSERDLPAQEEPVYAARVESPPAAARQPALGAPVNARFERREPTFTLDEVAEPQVDGAPEPMAVIDEPVMSIEPEPPTLPNIPVVEHPVELAQDYARVEPVLSARTSVKADMEPSVAPTLSEAVPPAEPVSRTPPESAPDKPAPAAPATKTANSASRRKIIALRIPMAERVPGTQLLSLLQSERLQHGKFSIFHRLQEGGTVFSIASMVEPGTFEPQSMHAQLFPGVTLFMLLPGPVDGLVAWDQMLSCAQRIAHATGGVLQDERGSKLTAQTMEKLREEVLDFQHLIGGMATT